MEASCQEQEDNKHDDEQNEEAVSTGIVDGDWEMMKEAASGDVYFENLKTGVTQ